MASISNIGTTASAGATGTSSIDNQIAVLDRRLERARELLASAKNSDMATDIKADRMASYQTQIVTLTDQMQALEQKRVKDKQSSSGEAAEKPAAQKEAPPAQTGTMKAVGGSSRSGAAGETVDVYA